LFGAVGHDRRDVAERFATSLERFTTMLQERS
jgi:hypothetical protein